MFPLHGQPCKVLDNICITKNGSYSELSVIDLTELGESQVQNAGVLKIFTQSSGGPVLLLYPMHL